jgi:hypothetical protein
MNTTKLARRLVLGIGIPAALATGAIAAAASSNGSSSDKPAATITQTAPGSTAFSTAREPGEDVRGNADENEQRGRANEPGEDVRGNVDEAEHQNEAGDDNGQNDQADDNGNPGGGAACVGVRRRSKPLSGRASPNRCGRRRMTGISRPFSLIVVTWICCRRRTAIGCVVSPMPAQTRSCFGRAIT